MVILTGRVTTTIFSATERCNVGTMTCCNYSNQCRNNVATLCCAKNRRCESSRVTSSNITLNKQRRNFISLSELQYSPLEFKVRRVRVHLTK